MFLHRKRGKQLFSFCLIYLIVKLEATELMQRKSKITPAIIEIRKKKCEFEKNFIFSKRIKHLFLSFS